MRIRKKIYSCRYAYERADIHDVMRKKIHSHSMHQGRRNCKRFIDNIQWKIARIYSVVTDICYAVYSDFLSQSTLHWNDTALEMKQEIFSRQYPLSRSAMNCATSILHQIVCLLLSSGISIAFENVNKYSKMSSLHLILFSVSNGFADFNRSIFRAEHYVCPCHRLYYFTQFTRCFRHGLCHTLHAYSSDENHVDMLIFVHFGSISVLFHSA